MPAVFTEVQKLWAARGHVLEFFRDQLADIRHQTVVGRAPIILAHLELGLVRADVVPPPDVQRVQRLRKGLFGDLGEGLAADRLIGRIAQTTKHRRVQLLALWAFHEVVKGTLVQNRYEVVNEYETRSAIKFEGTPFRRGPAILGKMEP